MKHHPANFSFIPGSTLFLHSSKNLFHKKPTEKSMTSDKESFEKHGKIYAKKYMNTEKTRYLSEKFQYNGIMHHRFFKKYSQRY